MVLTQGKLDAPEDLSSAHLRADVLLALSMQAPVPDLRHVPKWVRRFFHPRTLSEILRLTAVVEQPRDSFYLSCLLGILHHQRPGFLSYPSSHLVPYLRDKKYPRRQHPDLYLYRPLRPRLMAKISRTLRRPLPLPRRHRNADLQFAPVHEVDLPANFDCLITSPPYMNALDYGRDNRLRLWFLGTQQSHELDRLTGGFLAFQTAIQHLALKLQERLRSSGYAVFVIGDQKKRRGSVGYPAEELMRIMHDYAPSLDLETVIRDEIPDIRRARRHMRGVKSEHIIVYRKSHHAQASS